MRDNGESSVKLCNKMPVLEESFRLQAGTSVELCGSLHMEPRNYSAILLLAGDIAAVPQQGSVCFKW